MKDPREVIIRPIISEHSYEGMENNVYTFEVAKSANKIDCSGNRSHLRCKGR